MMTGTVDDVVLAGIVVGTGMVVVTIVVDPGIEVVAALVVVDPTIATPLTSADCALSLRDVS